jgi:hypothetical protein
MGSVVAAESSLRRTSGFAVKRRAQSRPAIGTIHRVGEWPTATIVFVSSFLVANEDDLVDPFVGC